MFLGQLPSKIYRHALLSAGVKDPEGVHHEFVKGQHGSKLDLEPVMSNRRSGAYILGLILKANMIVQQAQGQRIAIVGIANGMIQHGHDLASYMRWRYPRLNVIALDTRKYQSEGQKVIELTTAARKCLVSNLFDTAVLDDDVGTTGSSAAQPVDELRSNGIPDIFAAYDWIRSESLGLLLAKKVAAHGLINEPLANYQPNDCRAFGLCAKGSILVPYGEKRPDVV